MEEEVQDLIWEINPMGKPRMTRRDKWLSPPRDCVQNYWTFKDGLNLYAARDNYTPTAELSLTFVIPMPTSWSKKKQQAMIGTAHTQKPDLDNLVKAFKDSLCDNDEWIHTYNKIRKIWGQSGQIIIHQK